MQPFFKDYLNLLEGCHNEITRIVDELPSDALDWVPGAEMNSIAVLVFHFTGAERYWIGDVAMGESSNRDRDAEFKVQGLGKEAVKKRLDDSLSYAKTALEKLSVQDLETTCTSPRDGRTFTIGWSLLHALEHATLHLGHIQIAYQLWKDRK